MGSLSMDAQHQVVESVLKSYLKDEALSSAISLWDQQYRGQSFEKLSFFVFEIATTSTLRSLKKDILQELEHQLKGDVLQIHLDTQNPILTTVFNNVERPQDLPNSSHLKQQDIPLEKQKIELTEEDIQGHVIVSAAVLSEFFQSLLEALQAVNIAALKDIFDEYLQAEALPQFIKQEFEEFIFHNGQLKVLIYDAAHISKVTNILYSILCEYHGPVRTDRLVMQAIMYVEQKYPHENLRQFL